MGTGWQETAQIFILHHGIGIKNSKMHTCVKHHQRALRKFLLCWVSYSVVRKPSYVTNWWVMPAGDGRKIDQVCNTVMYSLLQQQHGGWNYYPGLLLVDFKSVYVFILRSMSVMKNVNKMFLHFHMLISLMRRGAEFKLRNFHGKWIPPLTTHILHFKFLQSSLQTQLVFF